MTLFANRQGSIVKVQCTYGPTLFSVEEDERSAAAFWSQLGRLLAEKPEHAHARAREGYQRYVEHSGGKSVHGEDLPDWDSQSDEVRQHWIAAFSG